MRGHQLDKHAEAVGLGSHRHVIGDGGGHAEEAHGCCSSERWGCSLLLVGINAALLVFSLLKPFLFSVPQMLAMMVDLEDDDEWAMADELEDDDFDR